MRNLQLLRFLNGGDLLSVNSEITLLPGMCEWLCGCIKGGEISLLSLVFIY